MADNKQDDPRFKFIPEQVVKSDVFEINAPASVVWSILVDLQRYNEWNPFCIRAESTLEIGAPIYMTLMYYPHPGTLAPNCEYISAFEPERKLSWDAPWLDEWPYPAIRDQIIEPTSDTTCRYWSTDAFLGENGLHVMNFCAAWVKRAFDDSGRALKARAEAMYKGQLRTDSLPIPGKT